LPGHANRNRGRIPGISNYDVETLGKATTTGPWRGGETRRCLEDCYLRSRRCDAKSIPNMGTCQPFPFRLCLNSSSAPLPGRPALLGRFASHYTFRSGRFLPLRRHTKQVACTIRHDSPRFSFRRLPQRPRVKAPCRQPVRLQPVRPKTSASPPTPLRFRACRAVGAAGAILLLFDAERDVPGPARRHLRLLLRYRSRTASFSTSLRPRAHAQRGVDALPRRNHDCWVGDFFSRELGVAF
jgi:hypothetical protein